jgi:hypothetical protein
LEVQEYAFKNKENEANPQYRLFVHCIAFLKINRGFFYVHMYFIQHCLICRPSDSTVSTDAGIEPRTVATSALAVREALITRLHLDRNSATSHPHSATSHPQLGYISSTTRLHLVHHSATSLPHSATSHPHSATSLPHSATSHPPLGYISSTTRLHLSHTRLHLIHLKLFTAKTRVKDDDHPPHQRKVHVLRTCKRKRGLSLSLHTYSLVLIQPALS